MRRGTRHTILAENPGDPKTFAEQCASVDLWPGDTLVVLSPLKSSTLWSKTYKLDSLGRLGAV